MVSSPGEALDPPVDLVVPIPAGDSKAQAVESAAPVALQAIEEASPWEEPRMKTVARAGPVALRAIEGASPWEEPRMKTMARAGPVEQQEGQSEPAEA